MVIWGLLLFIAGCVIADTARQYDEKKFEGVTFCDAHKNLNLKNDARCGHLVGATVILLFLVYIFAHSLLVRADSIR